jgi:hypothetical protein
VLLIWLVPCLALLLPPVPPIPAELLFAAVLLLLLPAFVEVLPPLWVLLW